MSNVLNRPERVAPETRARVQRVIEELGFVRNGSASSLRAGHGRIVGLMLLDLGNPFFAEVARGVEDLMSERDYGVILAGSASQAGREAKNMRMLAEQQVRGVLVTPVSDSRGSLALLRERGIATVLLDHPATRGDQCSVTVDDVTGGWLAVNHLLEQGARDVVFLGGPLTIRQNADRRKGALRAMQEAGTGTLRDVIVDEMNSRAGHEAAERLLAELPDAVFCANDLLAMGVLRVFLQQGIRVPGRVMVVGYDDIEYALASAVPLTSIRQPPYKLGRIAAGLLLDECDNPADHAHQQIMFQPELIIRESTMR